LNTKELVTQIGDIKELQDYAEPLQKAVRAALPRELKNLLHGTFLGHPLHPVLTDIPVGAWTAAQVLDAIGADDAADLAIGVGLAGALASALTGLADWSETDDRARSIGLVHGILNVVATSLYTASLISRKRKSSRQTGVALSMLGYATAFASAYLGGHLVFAEQIGVDHTATADQKKPEKYSRAMKADELKENKPAKCVVDGVSILLIKRGDEIYALTETCPHLGGPLSEGKIVNGAIECPWHGSQLAIDDGHAVNGPTTYPARCFDVRVRGGYIEVRAPRV
jgi:nitrite reductase/ring-hydroxylating ferredoxin subunit/uncharacterized membrane protein